MQAWLLYVKIRPGDGVSGELETVSTGFTRNSTWRRTFAIFVAVGHAIGFHCTT